MKRSTICWISLVFGMFLYIAPAVQSAGDVSASLSEEGRTAYQTLSRARVFRLGTVGPGVMLSQETRALKSLLKEKNALAALKALVEEGSPEGVLYGLVGLKQKDGGEYRRALAKYKSGAEPPEHAGPDSKHPVPKGKVSVQRGCIMNVESSSSIVNAIESGSYDGMFRRE